jgi:hypothetical protein
VNATWSQVLPITGGTLTGNLTIGAASALFFLNKPASGTGVAVVGQTGGLNRWQIVFGTGTAESGSNVGSDFLIRRYDDTGNTLDVPLTITRSSGDITINHDPTQALGVATKQYADTKVAQTGDTMTGPLAITPPSGPARINLNAIAGQPVQIIGNIAAAGQTITLFGQVAGAARWRVQLGNGAPEGGSNAGSDFGIARYSDAGALIDTPFSIQRSSGVISTTGTIALNATAAQPTASLLLQKNASGYQNLIYGTTAGSIRWVAMLGNQTAEGGGNAGSDFELDRYSDAGALIDTPFAIQRSTGKVSVNGAPVAPVLPKHLAGFTLANDASFPASNIDIDVGSACSDDNTTMMVLASPFIKNCTSAWAAGSGASSGALDTGSLAASTWYHVYLIERTDTYVVDVLISTSATSPTMPSGYTKKRRIGSFKTNASAQILLFTQYGDMFTWVNVINEVNAGVLPAGNNNPLALSGVPNGVRVVALIQATLYVTAQGPYMVIRPLDQTSAFQPGEQSLYGIAGYYPAIEMQVRTSTAQQIGISTGGSGANNYYVNTRGWIDYRGK